MTAEVAVMPDSIAYGASTVAVQAISIACHGLVGIRAHEVGAACFCVLGFFEPRFAAGGVSARAPFSSAARLAVVGVSGTRASP